MWRGAVALLLASCGVDDVVLQADNMMTDHGEIVRWADIPVTIKHGPEVPANVRTAINSMSQMINLYAGCEIYSSRETEQSLLTKTSPGNGGKWVGSWIKGYFVNNRCYIRVGSGGIKTESIALHELLHALAFSHVDDKTNIMNPTVYVAPTITDEQAVLLSRLYCGGEE